MVLFKNVFSALIMRFLTKNEKILNVGKIRKYDEEKMFFFSVKKRSHLSKLHLYEIGKAQNMPVVAGRLVGKNKINELGPRLGKTLPRFSAIVLLCKFGVKSNDWCTSVW